MGRAVAALAGLLVFASRRPVRRPRRGVPVSRLLLFVVGPAAGAAAAGVVDAALPWLALAIAGLVIFD